MFVVGCWGMTNMVSREILFLSRESLLNKLTQNRTQMKASATSESPLSPSVCPPTYSSSTSTLPAVSTGGKEHSPPSRSKSTSPWPNSSKPCCSAELRGRQSTFSHGLPFKHHYHRDADATQGRCRARPWNWAWDCAREDRYTMRRSAHLPCHLPCPGRRRQKTGTR